MRFKWHQTRFALIAVFWSLTLSAGAQVAKIADIERDGGWMRNSGNTTVIVFLHGLFSGPDAWICAKNSDFWPKMIVEDEDPIFSHDDVYVVKYPTPKRHGEMTMADLASNIYNGLASEGVFAKHQNVIFVAHSMGGVLTQQLLATYINEKLSDKVRAIFLYGTPNEGSNLANIARIFSRDPLLTELEAGENNLILPELDQRWHHAATTQIKRYCAYETKPEEGMRVVNRGSATRGCDDSVALDSNHRDLVKPCSTRDGGYTYLKRKLKEENANQVAPAPLPARPNQSFTTYSILGSTPYAHIDRLAGWLTALDYQRSEEIRRVSRDFAMPYKHGFNRDPMPTRMPDNYVDELIKGEVNASVQYAGMIPQITKAREDALECIDPTPNESSQDKTAFSAASTKAESPMSIKNLASNPQGGDDRFRYMIGYMQGLKDKLGDYHCTLH